VSKRWNERLIARYLEVSGKARAICEARRSPWADPENTKVFRELVDLLETMDDETKSEARRRRIMATTGV
jgi:hypothetical protein